MTVDWVIRHRIRLLLAALALAPLVHAFFGGSTLPIDSYRQLDGDTIVIRVGHAGGPTWTRVTSVRESDTRVEIAVRSVSAPVPMAGVLFWLDLTVDLDQPLGTRRVVDAHGHRPPNVDGTGGSGFYVPILAQSGRWPHRVG